jgi:hypothetical protein
MGIVWLEIAIFVLKSLYSAYHSDSPTRNCHIFNFSSLLDLDLYLSSVHLFSFIRSVSFEDKDVRLMMGTGDMRMRKMQVMSLSLPVSIHHSPCLFQVSFSPYLNFNPHVSADLNLSLIHIYRFSTIFVPCQLLNDFSLSAVLKLLQALHYTVHAIAEVLTFLYFRGLSRTIWGHLQSTHGRRPTRTTSKM